MYQTRIFMILLGLTFFIFAQTPEAADNEFCIQIENFVNNATPWTTKKEIKFLIKPVGKSLCRNMTNCENDPINDTSVDLILEPLEPETLPTRLLCRDIGLQWRDCSQNLDREFSPSSDCDSPDNGIIGIRNNKYLIEIYRLEKDYYGNEEYVLKISFITIPATVIL